MDVVIVIPGEVAWKAFDDAGEREKVSPEFQDFRVDGAAFPGRGLTSRNFEFSADSSRLNGIASSAMGCFVAAHGYFSSFHFGDCPKNECGLSQTTF